MHVTQVGQVVLRTFKAHFDVLEGHESYTYIHMVMLGRVHLVSVIEFKVWFMQVTELFSLNLCMHVCLLSGGWHISSAQGSVLLALFRSDS